jgi:glycerate 2-kinase
VKGHFTFDVLRFHVMNIVIAPDKFKGSLTTFEACQIIADGFKRAEPSVSLSLFPMADGGDGFAQVMKYYVNTDTVDCNTVDPLERNIKGSYEWNAMKQVAIIEIAVASGLVLLKEEEQNPLKTSTYGTGLLIKDAIRNGAKEIVLGLGGSATTDAGTGILSALGFQFLDANNKSLGACGESLLDIKQIIAPIAIPRVTFEIACDVQNILFGPKGAAHVYGRQKGADDGAIKLLDDGLKHFAEILQQHTGHDVADIPGAGAAGGIAAGLMGFFKVQLKSGVQMIIEVSGIKNKMARVDLVVTGEGKIDRQTLSGKVVSELARLASSHNIPVAAFCGTSELNNSQIKKLGVQYLETLMSPTVTKQEAINNARQILQDKARDFLESLF